MTCRTYDDMGIDRGKSIKVNRTITIESNRRGGVKKENNRFEKGER